MSGESGCIDVLDLGVVFRFYGRVGGRQCVVDMQGLKWFSRAVVSGLISRDKLRASSTHNMAIATTKYKLQCKRLTNRAWGLSVKARSLDLCSQHLRCSQFLR